MWIVLLFPEQTRRLRISFLVTVWGSSNKLPLSAGAAHDNEETPDLRAENLAVTSQSLPVWLLLSRTVTCPSLEPQARISPYSGGANWTQFTELARVSRKINQEVHLMSCCLQTSKQLATVRRFLPDEGEHAYQNWRRPEEIHTLDQPSWVARLRTHALEFY